MSHNFEQIGGQKVFRPWGQWTEGDSITGRFSAISQDSFGNDNFEIEVEEVEFDDDLVIGKNKKGEDVKYAAPKAGEIFALNACGSLEKAMEKCDIGDVIKVIYTGTIVLTKGKFAGKPAHTMKVLRSTSAGRKVSTKQHAEVIEDDSELPL